MSLSPMLDEPTWTASASEMLFVTGASRSGTTMLNRILGSHARVLGLQELHYFGATWDLARRGEPLAAESVSELGAVLHARQVNGFYGAGPAEADRAFGRELAAQLRAPDGLAVFLEATRRLARLEGKQIACEQTPRNIYYAKQLLELDAGIRVIQLIRDPRAVAASQKSRWKRRRLGAANVPLAEVVRTWSNYHPRTMSRLWLGAVRCGLTLQGHPRFLAIRFEDLVASPEATVRELCAFAGLDFQPEMLDVPIVGSSLKQDQGLRGISAHGVDSWRESLSACEVRLIEDTCSSAMQRHGYVLSQPNCSAFGRAAFGVLYPLHLAAVALSNPRRAWIQFKALIAQ